jgi:hydroxymethylglutaryl-CoA lyase
MSYPTCYRSFKEFCNSNKHITNRFVNKLIRVRPFDVTLRDGMQKSKHISTITKQEIYNNIINKYGVSQIEIGSCVNPKILPIFSDTEELFSYVNNKNQVTKTVSDLCIPLKHYVLVPNEKQLMRAIKMGANHFSFITSVSNSFQLKNTKMNLTENLVNLKNMLTILNETASIETNEYRVKLYVSCITECPIEGEINLFNIVSELYVLSLLNVDMICLSDTCGTLTHDTFVLLIEYMKKLGLDMSRFSLHLHVNPDRENEVEQIVHTAIDCGIMEFDVSELNNGGCSVTMDNEKMLPNMNYQQYYKFLTNYLLK